jgi:hypothetical protein
MALTFFATDAARGDTGVEQFADDLFIRPRSSAAECSERVAHVCAVEVQSDALTELRHHLFCETRVGT